MECSHGNYSYVPTQVVAWHQIDFVVPSYQEPQGFKVYFKVTQSSQNHYTPPSPIMHNSTGTIYPQRLLFLNEIIQQHTRHPSNLPRLQGCLHATASPLVFKILAYLQATQNSIKQKHPKDTGKISSSSTETMKHAKLHRVKPSKHHSNDSSIMKPQ